MQRTRVGSLLLVAALATAATWAVVRALSSQGVLLPEVPWATVVVLLFIAAVVFWLGWTVRQYLHGRRPGLDAIRAARTAVLAKASCYAGALLTGWYLAQVLSALTGFHGEVAAGRAWPAVLAVLGSVVLSVVGLLVEWFCRIPPPDDGKDTDRVGDRAPDPAAG